MKRLLMVFSLIAMAVSCCLMCACEQSPVGDPSTILIYVCGSNLESKEGLASRNIDELLAARIPDNVNVVLETGGTTSWASHGIANDKLQRYEVKGGKLNLVEELDNASMGDPDTFLSFLEWGMGNYASQKNVLVLWDHGGKSAESICFDENYEFDSLDREELAEALDGVGLERKLDFVVLDACFMSSLENAVLMNDYAEYMIASQEVIPSIGLDYRYLPYDVATMDSKELGRSICNRYLEKCEQYDKVDMAELSFLDLSKTQKVVDAFEKYCGYLEAAQGDKDYTTKISGATTLSATYGSTSVANLFDLDVFVEASQTFGIDASSDDFVEAYQELVDYRVQGRNTDCEGISLYYPLGYDKDDFEWYMRTCPIEGYASLLRGIFGDVPDDAVVLDDAGSIAKDGSFRVKLAEGSYRFVSSVSFRLSRKNEKRAGQYALVGSGYNIHRDWDNDTFQSDFDGTWPALAGSPLLTDVYQTLPYTIAYSAPVEVNGDRTNFVTVYRFTDEYRDGEYIAGNLWDGYDEHDIPSKSFTPIVAGDEVAVCEAVNESGETTRAGEAYRVPDGSSEDEANHVEDVPLEDGTYRYQFVFTDILGREVMSDYGVFEIDDGEAKLAKVQPA